MFKKRKRDRGFTLIELLATIVILAIVSGFAIYVAVNLIDNSRVKGYLVTINNIEDKAIDYLNENSDKLFYQLGNDNDIEYQCVTVRELVNMGYFKNNITKSKVRDDRYVQLDDYIYIARDVNTKTIVKNEYLLDVGNGLCGKPINVDGNVLISVTPDGYSKYKDVTIKYTLKNYYNIDDYAYKYSYDKNEYSCNGDNCSVEEIFSVLSDDGDVKKIRVYDNGKITGYIEGLGVSNFVDITKIDITSPTIEMNDIVKVYGVSFDLMEGVSILDNVDENVSSSVYLGDDEITSYSDLKLGENIVTYKAVDSLGNETSKTRKITIVLPDKEFNYLESDQVYEVMADGTYIVEAYGAQGGNSGGLGGYVKAEIVLKVGDKLIVNTGGVNGYNGGGGYKGSGYYPGGGASTVRYNGDYMVIAGGGGAKGNQGSGGAGGSGNGAGGDSVGAGAGKSGSNGGGGSNSLNHSYGCNCSTCGGACKNWVAEYSCNCVSYPYSCNCKQVFVCGNCVLLCKPWCVQTQCGTCWGSSCQTCGGYCSSYYPTYECNCDTCTNNGESGKGGSNKVATSAKSIENKSGVRSGNGFIKISYKLED